jgi:hypothetical protein
MAVVASATGAAVFGLSGVAAGLAGGALLGAGAGALYSGITGDGNILDSALTGALLGGAAGGLGAAFAPAAAGGTGLTATAPLTGTGALAPGAASAVSTPSAALTAAKGSMAATAYSPTAAAAQQAALGLGATAPVAGAAPVASTFGTFAGAGAPSGLATTQTLSGLGAGTKTAAALTPKQMLATGLAGTTALSLLGNRNQPKLSTDTGTTPSYIRPYTYSSTPVPAGDDYPSPFPSTPLYNAQGNPILDTRERNYFDQTFTAGEPYRAASGGLMAAGGPVERMSMMNTTMNPQGGLYPMGMIDKTQYATPTQRPVSSEVIMQAPAYERSNPMLMAKGGITYDPATQRYSGLPSMSSASAGDSTPLSAELIAQLTPQYQAANPNAFSYDPAQQRYGAVNPTMAQLNAYKAEQDRIAAEQAAQQMDPFMGLSPFNYAAGGNVQGYNLGGYSDGGRLLRGPGDGVSDDIPATIGNRQPARLADGEFVIPARIVSELGNGSTDAGAKRLYAMMDRIQAGRKKTVGKNNVAKDSKAKKHLLA